MAKIFNISLLTEERKRELCAGYCGSYTYDFRRASIERLGRMSRGFSAEALSIMAGRIVVMSSDYDADGVGRFYPIPEQFTAEEVATLAGGSFKVQAVQDWSHSLHNNGLFSNVAICLECGKVFDRGPVAHTCGELECLGCGAVLHTDAERAERHCPTCQAKRIGKKYGYHRRIYKNRPMFEKPDAREAEVSLGGEIEIDGGTRACFGDEEAMAFSTLLNKDPFKPFVEFESDASLCNGVECITRPMTFAGFWKMRAKLNEFYKMARDFGGQFKRANGLHFHIDRDFFGHDEEARGKASVLIEMMVYKYFDFFATISRREAGAFGYARKKDGVNSLYTAFREANWQEHAYAVNGSGENTIEIRFFGGHISTGDDFLACADMVQSIAKWAKASTLAQAEKATVCDLVKYLRKPDNVKAFLDGAIAERPRTVNGDKWLDDFKTALQARIDRNSAPANNANEEA